MFTFSYITIFDHLSYKNVLYIYLFIFIKINVQMSLIIKSQIKQIILTNVFNNMNG
jgi:hypothetical protein